MLGDCVLTSTTEGVVTSLLPVAGWSRSPFASNHEGFAGWPGQVVRVHGLRWLSAHSAASLALQGASRRRRAVGEEASESPAVQNRRSRHGTPEVVASPSEVVAAGPGAVQQRLSRRC